MLKNLFTILKYSNRLVINNRQTVLKLSGFIIFLSIAIGLVEVSVAYCLRHFLSISGFIKEDLGESFLSHMDLTFVQISILLFVAYFFRFIVQVFNTQVISYLAEIINIRIKSIVLFDFLYQRAEHPRSSGDVFYNFIEILPKSVSFFNSLIVLTSFCLQAVLIYFVMLYKTPYEAIISVFGVLFIGISTIHFSKKMRPQTLQIPTESRDLTTRVEKISKNLLFFNVMRTKDGELISFGKNLANLSNLVLKQTTVSSTINAIPQLLGFTFIIIIVFLSRSYFHTGANALIGFLYLFMRFTSILSAISQQFTILYTYHPQLASSYEFLETVEKEIERKSIILTSSLDFLGRTGKKTMKDNLIPTEERKENSAPASSPSPPGIEIENISFKYPASNHSILSNFSLRIKSGDFYGIKGTSGKGKSTLLMLITGILQPQEGKVLIDSEHPENFFNKSMNRIGYVGAEPYLVRGTLHENLLYGLKYRPSETELWSALKRASADLFVEQVGLDYRINEDHSGISAGQKQRLCIARALLNDPTLLILDEATSNLDVITEEIILNELKKLKGKVTIIFVSHRAAPLEYADSVLDM